jgi:tRNA(fMet)-specific endonuclease VapC
MRYLLDTNIVSELVRNPQGKMAQHIRSVGEAQVCTSVIVSVELRYGATKKGSPKLPSQLEAVLGRLTSYHLRSRPMLPTAHCERA